MWCSTEELLSLCQNSISEKNKKNTAELLADWTVIRTSNIQREISKLREMQPNEWQRYIESHPCHHHPWYDFLSEKATLSHFANFFFENGGVPSFVNLVQATLSCQITDSGKAAVLENIADEDEPLPHAELMKRLMLALRPHRTRNHKKPDKLLQRQLTTYSGYLLDPWQLVGSLFAIESMGSYRMQKMWEGLTRLELKEEDIEYVKIHITCDEHHAAEWYESVISASLKKQPDLLPRIRQGIALVLTADFEYLDDLMYSVPHVD